MLTLRNAVENASIDPVSDGQIVAALRGDGSTGSHLRAIFGDASLATLAEAGRSNGVEFDTILAAYQAARRHHQAANRELDELLGSMEPPAAAPAS